jgi:23S rRNA (cytidine1920-2'-O)/16S rRNA (cytidine1409-2'-O)-methyltransferase
LAPTTDLAARLVMAGRVYSAEQRVEKPGTPIDAAAPLTVRAGRRYVSRGGDKLAHALDHFDVPVDGRVCCDAGCSTGGFTDCLLGRGAELVHAIDVGYGQLAWKLREDPRVVVRERTNVRTLGPADFRPRPQLLVADLSFISLRTVLPVFAGLVVADSWMVLLVKPQFELPRADVSGGVVGDPALHARAVELVEGCVGSLGLSLIGSTESPLLGADGNREFFVVVRTG